MPVFYLYGYKDIFKKSTKNALIATLPVLLCISGTGIAIMGIVWGYYFFFNLRNFNAKQLFGIAIIAVVFAIIYVNSTGLITMVEEMSDSSENKTLDRVTRGFLLFGDLPLDKELFGIGFQNVMAASKVYHMKLANVISNGHNEYVCDIASILLTGGIVGFTYVIYLLRRIFFSKKMMFKNMSIAVLGIFISEATLGALTLFYVLIVLATYNKDDNYVRDYKTIRNNSSI